MKKITIAEPCHENWNDFTPTQRGAFCGKCQINVIDFSTKSNTEIKNLLIINNGKKMCGRFSKTQLDTYNSEYLDWQNQTQNTFQSKFIFALVLVFGLTLFSCSSQNESNSMKMLINSVMDTTIVISNDTIKTDSIETITPTPVCNTDFEMGDVEYDYPEDIEMMLGEIVEIPREKEVVESDSNQLDLEFEQPMLQGMIAYTQDPLPYTDLDTADIITRFTAKKNTVLSLTDKFEANLYPNPTKNKATLKLNVLSQETYNITIFDSQGRIIKQLYSGILTVGERIFNIDLSHEKSGIYFIKMITETQNESLKFIKNK